MSTTIKKLESYFIQYLQYVKNTGGNATIENFDDDWEPIGPRIREKLIPTYVMENEHGRLILTQAGNEELNNG